MVSLSYSMLLQNRDRLTEFVLVIEALPGQAEKLGKEVHSVIAKVAAGRIASQSDVLCQTCPMWLSDLPMSDPIIRNPEEVYRLFKVWEKQRQINYKANANPDEDVAYFPKM